MKTQPITLKLSEREQIAEILSRRANEIAGYKSDHSFEKYPPADPKNADADECRVRT